MQMEMFQPHPCLTCLSYELHNHLQTVKTAYYSDATLSSHSGGKRLSTAALDKTLKER